MQNVFAKLQENIQKSTIKPAFADEVVVMRNIKARKNEKGEYEKEGHFALVFVDMMNQQPIAKFILSISTVRQLHLILGKELEKMKKDLESKDVPKKPVVESVESTETTGYIG
jgi:hypothetical protein